MTVGLDLSCRLKAKATARVHHGRGQHTAFGFLKYQRLQKTRYKRQLRSLVDAGIVPVKVANKELSSPAEPLEGRAATKRNPQDQSIRRTQRRVSMQQAAARIRQAVKRKPKDKLTALLHHVTPWTLREAFFQLKKTSAAGVDGVTWEKYKEGLDDHLIDLHHRIRRGSYRARPSRRVEIPKADGGTRPLGIAALEDKIVQKAVVEIILMPIYESEFLGFRYGFRPGRGAHDALDALAVGIEEHKVSWVVDADVRAFFDRIDRNWLIEFLALRIGDKRVIRLIIKWLNAGVMEGHQWQDDLRGTPHGAVVSPLIWERSHISGYGNLMIMGT